MTIQQYLDGSLDKKLMHELEKKALEDPFLADALEGYALNPAADHGLSILQRQLHERIMHQQENKKVFDLSWQRLSIAAAAAVMFITAGVLFWMNGNVPDQKLAGSPKHVDVRVTPIDSLPQNQEVAVLPSPTPEKIKRAEISPLTRAKETVRPKVASRMSIATSANETAKRRLLIHQSQEARIADRQEDLFKAAQAKKVEGFALSDSASIQSIEGASKQPLSQVTMNSFAGDSQQKARAKGVEDYKKYIEENFFKASPAGGWEAYRTYLKENISRSATSLKQKGKIVIGFKVNQLGDLSDFKVLKGLSPDADSLAIQLIKNGPPWKALPQVKTADLKIELDF